MFSGRRQPSCDDTSRMMREYQVRFCEGLGVKSPGPTLQTFREPLKNLLSKVAVRTRDARASK